MLVCSANFKSLQVIPRHEFERKRHPTQPFTEAEPEGLGEGRSRCGLEGCLSCQRMKIQHYKSNNGVSSWINGRSGSWSARSSRSNNSELYRVCKANIGKRHTESVLHCLEPCNNKRSTSSVGSMFTMSSRYVQVKYNLISM
ncbi:hypothetical protein NQ318_000713 [Aromia moschata]|uniref:Uncharacterized protein n=1 Tax=Aromia moschata TaxID=1265417 RepID=A0AAV8XWH3_9CUCU|nr:hypothetical protein NQ318_000713 [Aromia moschata]